MNSTVIVAIDGPAGSGKSSVAKGVAAKLGYGMLDTGAAYRALTWRLLQDGVDLTASDCADLALKVLAAWQLQLPLSGAPDARIHVDGVDVTDAIREPHVTEHIKYVSSLPAVREALNTWFRGYVAASDLPGVVTEGRDTTTVVFPQAAARIILTAAVETRAARRQKQLPEMSFEQVLADLKVRDAADLKVVNFIDPAPGVQLIDTTELDFDGSVAAVVAYVQQVTAKLEA